MFLVFYFFVFKTKNTTAPAAARSNTAPSKTKSHGKPPLFSPSLPFSEIAPMVRPVSCSELETTELEGVLSLSEEEGSEEEEGVLEEGSEGVLSSSTVTEVIPSTYLKAFSLTPYTFLPERRAGTVSFPP